MEAKRFQWLLVVLVSLAWAGVACGAQGEKAPKGGGKIVLTPDQIQWQAAPPDLPDAQMAVIDGDPKKKGLFVFRLKLPAGAKIPAHYHGDVEKVTVLSGKMNLAMGASPDNPVALPAGSYFSLPSGTVHNAWVDEETIVQVASIGPWSMHLKKGVRKGGASGTHQ